MNEKLFYCRMCGSLHQMFECKDYDPDTGKKIWRQACPQIGCEKNCDFFEHDYKNCSWIGYTAKCRKCGYSPPDYY